MKLLNDLSMFAQAGELIHQLNRGVNGKKYFQNFYLVRFLIYGAHRYQCLFLQQAKSIDEIYHENLDTVEVVNTFLSHTFGLPDQFDFRMNFTRNNDNRPYSAPEMYMLSSLNGSGGKLARILILGYFQHKRFISHEHGQTTKTLEKDAALSEKLLSEFLEKYCRPEVLTQ